MAGALNFGEYPSEKIFEAQDLYCVDRLTYEAAAERTGVSVPTLKRWADKYGWRAKREELARMESEIRHNTYKARARMLTQVVEGGGALDAFAAAKLETLAMEQTRFKMETAAQAAPPASVKFETPAQAAALLADKLGAKLGALLAAPGTIDLKEIKNLRDALKLLEEMRGAEAVDENAPAAGLSSEADARIRALLEGGL